ncbi:GMP synthase [Microbacterium sp. SORGH_AS_0888]|uniref:glutamine amidotransferase-related protein n=1 Tax=Microbacterium sp. SORGH_AS_0888 TaxID=3041791 RepID=UPI00277E2777|nr:GMP synthase [Microbacterium sp. SORGH_AS_0888]MDQ1129420.1 GMP synthase (glutamine-hydrolyzing) [Microbacterium sp. SORGH_AS_0888]
MHSRPLLYVCARPQQDAAAGEYASFRAATGLDEHTLHRHDLVRDPLPDDALERYAGFMTGGSPFNVTDPEPSEAQVRLEHDLERIAAAAAAGTTAALFTCYGIGVVSRMLGGAVTQEYAEGTGAVSITLTADGAADPVFGVLPPRFDAFTAHKEGTSALPPGAVLLAENPACPVQGYRVGDRLYTTQFHPELAPADFVARMRIYRDAGYFDPSEFEPLSVAVLAAPVTQPARLLRAFASRCRAA